MSDSYFELRKIANKFSEKLEKDGEKSSSKMEADSKVKKLKKVKRKAQKAQKKLDKKLARLEDQFVKLARGVTMKLKYFDEDGNKVKVRVPAKCIVCEECDGAGQVTSSHEDIGDNDCAHCKGKGSHKVFDSDRASDEEIKAYELYCEYKDQSENSEDESVEAESDEDDDESPLAEGVMGLSDEDEDEDEDEESLEEDFSVNEEDDSEAEMTAASKSAVIIKGNPKYITDNPHADKFYGDLKDHLESEGYSVSFDAGKPLTSPKKADLWVGHSRGADRLRFAPEGTRTVALGVPDGLMHPKDNTVNWKPGSSLLPNKHHFELTDEMRRAISGGEKIASDQFFKRTEFQGIPVHLDRSEELAEKLAERRFLLLKKNASFNMMTDALPKIFNIGKSLTGMFPSWMPGSSQNLEKLMSLFEEHGDDIKKSLENLKEETAQGLGDIKQKVSEEDGEEKEEKEGIANLAKNLGILHGLSDKGLDSLNAGNLTDAVKFIKPLLNILGKSEGAAGLSELGLSELAPLLGELGGAEGLLAGLGELGPLLALL